MENQTPVSNPAHGVGIVQVTPAPDISEFIRLVKYGAECWVAAGEMLVKLRAEDKFAFQKINEAHPFITIEALEIFYHIGCKTLYPLVMLLPRDICAKVRTMRYEAQKEVTSNPVEIVSRMEGDKPVIIRKSVAKMTRDEARRALGPRGQVPVKAQIKNWIEKVTPPLLPKPKPMLPKELNRKPISRGLFSIRRGAGGDWIFEKTQARPYHLQTVMLTDNQAVIELCNWGGGGYSRRARNKFMNEKIQPPTIPSKMLRVVVQVRDTPENQLAMKNMFAAMKKIGIPDTRNAIIKAEQIVIVAACCTKSDISEQQNPPPRSRVTAGGDEEIG